MARILGACLALTLAGMAPAMADEPVRLDDATLDAVTAGATALAGFQATLDPGGTPVIVDTVALGVDNQSFQLQGGLAGPTGEAGINAAGQVSTETNPYAVVSVAQISGVTGAAGTGSASIGRSASVSGQRTGSGAAIIRIPGANGITQYYGTSWAWGFDVPTVNSTQ